MFSNLFPKKSPSQCTTKRTTAAWLAQPCSVPTPAQGPRNCPRKCQRQRQRHHHATVSLTAMQLPMLVLARLPCNYRCWYNILVCGATNTLQPRCTSTKHKAGSESQPESYREPTDGRRHTPQPPPNFHTFCPPPRHLFRAGSRTLATLGSCALHRRQSSAPAATSSTTVLARRQR